MNNLDNGHDMQLFLCALIGFALWQTIALMFLSEKKSLKEYFSLRKTWFGIAANALMMLGLVASHEDILLWETHQKWTGNTAFPLFTGFVCGLISAVLVHLVVYGVKKKAGKDAGEILGFDVAQTTEVTPDGGVKATTTVTPSQPVPPVVPPAP